MSDQLAIAVLTDVHGNAFAAEAVATEIQKAQPDLIVNLGDQVWGQAKPLEALEIQKSLGAIEIRGNNDERLMMPEAAVPPEKKAIWHWLSTQLPLMERERLANLPTNALLADGAVLATHGTPSSPWDSLLWRWDREFFRHRSDQEIASRLAEYSEPQVILVGHMHRENIRHLAGQLLINVGPVAHQNDGDPRARWTLLQRRAGQWSVKMNRTDYDWNAPAQWIKTNPVADPLEADLHDQPRHDPVTI